MIELTAIEGLIKYAKELIDNLKGRQIISAKTTKIYRIDGGTKTLVIPAMGISSFAISFIPDSGKACHAELLLDIDIENSDEKTLFYDIQITPFQPVDGTDWLVRYWNKYRSDLTRNISVAVNALEPGTIILR